MESIFAHLSKKHLNFSPVIDMCTFKCTRIQNGECSICYMQCDIVHRSVYAFNVT